MESNYYLEFENMFRGNREQIIDNLKPNTGRPGLHSGMLSLVGFRTLHSREHSRSSYSNYSDSSYSNYKLGTKMCIGRLTSTLCPLVADGDHCH